MSKQNYIAVMFPYPSGNGLHVGHSYNYSIIDSYCRYKRYIGEDVFQPFGFDSFGLPAELYAKKIGRNPREVTQENIGVFRKQMENMNTLYEEKLITSDPSYQKWTQWLFTKLLESGLAYKKFAEVDYCPECETTLAREQIIDGKCERHKTPTEKKELEQWYFKITEYKDRLIKNLDWIDYPEKTKKQQRAWLENLHDWCVSRQRSWGCPIPIEGETDTLDTFVDSSFYYIRYCDSDNESELCAKDKYKQVDLYVGGNEHACMHLIYARFINMFLYDIGVVSEEEPFKKLIHQGMILNNGEKMSKSLGNIVSPDDYDSDELRFYLMFIGHYFDGGSWNDSNFKGIPRFINKLKTWLKEEGQDEIDLESFEKRIFDYTEAFKFNKVVSEWMILLNNNKSKKLSAPQKQKIKELLEIYMPNITTKLTNFEQ